MVAAVKDVEDGMGIREASRLYNIPYETLRRRTHHVVSLDCRSGPPTVLTHEEEEQLACYCVKMADMGFGLSREELMRTACRIAECSGRKHPFAKGTAGRAWYDGFKSRHPKLTLRSSQSLSYSRAACTNEEIIKDYFSKLGAVCAGLNILTKPMQIFNTDETGLSIVHKPGKVITELGRRNVWSITSAEKGKTHTILTCVSASGYALPPFMIYPRKRVTDNLKVGCFPGSVFHCSDNGWVICPLFIEWFEFFLRTIPATRPVLLVLDGHASHVSIEVLEMARNNDIHMLCLPAHTTHLLQPLDGVFKSLKCHYYKVCKKYIVDHPGRVVTTDVIASLLASAWPQSVTPMNIMAGFKKYGLYPLNPGEVTDRQIAPSKSYCSAQTGSEKRCVPPVVQASGTDDLDSLYQKRYEEGYDMYDSEYVSWLQRHHPKSVPSQCKLLTSATADVSSHGDATGSNSSTYTSASKYMYNIKLIISIVNYFLICRHIAWFLTV